MPGTRASPPASVRPDADERGGHSGFPTSDTVTAEEPPLQAGTPAVQSGSVCINETQYFDGVPETAWNFYIGGYQPAQKWLKDRKGCVLTYDDIKHYQKIIVALTETHQLMGEINKIEI